MGWLRRNRFWALAGVLAVCGSVLIAASIHMWVSDQARYDAFRSSAMCAQGPVQADADCVSLRPARVLDVQNNKSETDVSVQGWAELEYDDPGFVSGLRAGESVDVIVWRGAVQGLEYAGQPDYLSESAVLAPSGDYAQTVLGVFLLCLGALFGADSSLRRRGASRGRISAVRWSFGAAAALAIVNVLGVILSNSLTGGLVADGLLGAATLVVVGLMWAFGGQRLGRAPVRTRTAGISTRPSANARKRPRPKSRSQARQRPRSR